MQCRVAGSRGSDQQVYDHHDVNTNARSSMSIAQVWFTSAAEQRANGLGLEP